MNEQAITVVYKWIANPGKAEELKAIYREVEKQMQELEEWALAQEYPTLEEAIDHVYIPLDEGDK